jgi:hypothetical protein
MDPLRARFSVHRADARRCLFVLLGLLAFFRVAAARAQTHPPEILSGPEGGAAGVGETFAFTVSAEGTSPLDYQWYFGAAPIDRATNASLLLTNLGIGNGGNYSVVVTNGVGSVTSAVASLSVVSGAPRVLWVSGVTASESGGASAPLVFNANGREQVIQFSLQFDTNHFGAPVYQWDSGYTATVIDTNVDHGQVGFQVSPAQPGLFASGSQQLGTLEFDLLNTNSTPLDGGLVFTSFPVDPEAVDSNALQMLLADFVVPQINVEPEQPELNLQTGLFEQRVEVANPSGQTFIDLPVYVPWMGVDDSTNTISLYTASGVATVDVAGDGQLQSAYFTLVDSLAPGASVTFTNTFYVTDHATAPLADYYAGVGGSPGVPMPGWVVPLRIDRIAVEVGNLVLEWGTRPNRLYSVHFADEPAHLADSDLFSIATNGFPGTGHTARWVDNSAMDASRYYQVVETP